MKFNSRTTPEFKKYIQIKITDDKDYKKYYTLGTPQLERITEYGVT